MNILRVITLMLAFADTSLASASATDDFFKAVRIDDVRAVRALIARDFDPNTADAAGDPGLIVAIRNDASKVAELLIADPKVDPDRTNASLETPMMLAAHRNRKDLVEKLVARGAEVNRKGWTALHYAASVGNVEIVKLLLDSSAYIDAESPNQTTPLMMAARSKKREVCKLLIEEGADPSLINQRDLTAADFALRAGDTELAESLKKDADAWRQKHPR